MKTKTYEIRSHEVYGRFFAKGEDSFLLEVHDEYRCEIAEVSVALVERAAKYQGEEVYVEVRHGEELLRRLLVKRRRDRLDREEVVVMTWTGHRFFTIAGAAEEIAFDTVARMGDEAYAGILAAFAAKEEAKAAKRAAAPAA